MAASPAVNAPALSSASRSRNKSVGGAEEASGKERTTKSSFFLVTRTRRAKTDGGNADEETTVPPPIPKSAKTVQMPLNDDKSRILSEGWIVKQGHVRKNWKGRWFVLTPISLTYAKSRSKMQTPKGQIDLCKNPDSIAVTRAKDNEFSHRPFCFKIVLRNNKNKEYALDCQSQENMEQWMRVISQALADNIANMSYVFFRDGSTNSNSSNATNNISAKS